MSQKSKLEYIWLDGYKPTQYLRSKTRIERDFSGNVEVVFPNEAGTLVTSAQASDDATALAIALG